MQPRAKSHRRLTPDFRKPNFQWCAVERLESRTLLSFSTVDTVPNGVNEAGLAADGVGNVYVAGDDDSGYYVRQGSNGGTTWTNIYSLPYPATGVGPQIEGVGASPAGDVYVAIVAGSSGWSVLERQAGTTQFSQVASSPGPYGGPQGPNFLSVDAAGNVYFIAEKDVITTGSGGKTTSTGYAQVWRRQGATGAFALVDTSPAAAFGTA